MIARSISSASSTFKDYPLAQSRRSRYHGALELDAFAACHSPEQLFATSDKHNLPPLLSLGQEDGRYLIARCLAASSE